MNRKTGHYVFGPFYLDGDGRRLLNQGRPLHLTTKVFDILLLLVQNHGEVVEKEVFMKEVWLNSFVEESNLTVCISMLRKALGEGRSEVKYIKTVAGRGYRFVVNVREAHEPQHLASGKPGGERGEVISSLAVLPLVNASHDPNMEYLSDGITESLINNLAQILQLSVIASNVVFRYKGKTEDPQRVGQELNVPAVMAGRVSLLADRLAISVELIDVADGHQIWGERYARQMSDIFLVQEEIAREISKGLRLRLNAEERGRLSKRYTENTEAFHLYLKGRHAWNKRTEEGLRRSIEYFKRAVGVDPNYALAYAGLADSYYRMSSYGLTPLQESILDIETAAHKALAIDPMLAEPHATLGALKAFRLWDWSEGERELKLAIELDPNYAYAHLWYAIFLRTQGWVDESLAELRRAQELDPLSVTFNTAIAAHFYFTRQYDQAISQLQETLELDSNNHIVHFVLGRVYEQMGMSAQALAHCENAVRYSGSDPETLGYLGYMLAKLGEGARARELIAQLKSLSEHKYFEAHAVGYIHLGLGEIDQAFEWFEKSYQERSTWLLILNLDPWLDGLRSDPRFISLLRRTELLT